MLPHHIVPFDVESLDDSFLNIGAGSGHAVSFHGFPFLSLGHAVCQEHELDCNTVDALFDFPASGQV